jgi:hypothetical protein
MGGPKHGRGVGAVASAIGGVSAATVARSG